MRVKLKDIATYINGKAFKPSEWTESGIPIVRIQNLNNPNREFNYYDKEVAEKYIIDNGDILISWSATLDIFEWNRGKAYLNQHIFKVLFDKDLEVDKSYFQFSMKSVLHTLERFVHGSTMKHIVKKDFENIQIPLPPLTQQKKIAHTLDKAKELIELRKKSIEKLDALAKSLFVDMFGDPVENPMGWEVVEVQKVCDEIVDCINRTAPIVNHITDYKMIRTTNVKNYKIVFHETRYVEKDIYEKWIRRLKPKKYDIVFTREAPVGEAGIITSDENYFLGQRTMLFRTNFDKLDSYYLLYELLGSNVERQIHRMSTGSTVKHLSVPDCKKFKINLPPLPLQQKFAKTIQKIESQKSLYENELAKLEENFEALLAKSFA